MLDCSVFQVNFMVFLPESLFQLGQFLMQVLQHVEQMTLVHLIQTNMMQTLSLLPATTVIQLSVRQDA